MIAEEGECADEDDEILGGKKDDVSSNRSKQKPNQSS